jgi:hypothetical protein
LATGFDLATVELEAGAVFTTVELEAGAVFTTVEPEAGAVFTTVELEAGAVFTTVEPEAGAVFTTFEPEAGAVFTTVELEAGAVFTTVEPVTGAVLPPFEPSIGAGLTTFGLAITDFPTFVLETGDFSKLIGAEFGFKGTAGADFVTFGGYETGGCVGFVRLKPVESLSVSRDVVKVSEIACLLDGLSAISNWFCAVVKLCNPIVTKFIVQISFFKNIVCGL